MAKKRGNGEGTIYKMASGKWRAQIVGPLGTRQSLVAATQSECQRWLVERKSEQLRGINSLANNITLKEFLANWLRSASASKSRKTIILYQSTLAPVMKYLGAKAIREIRPDQIQAAYNRLLESGKSPYAVRRIHKVLHVAFAFGVKLRVLARNPVSDATPPKHVPQKMSCLDSTQVQALLLAAQAIGDKYYPLYYLAISTGMRQAELLGLKWADVDWNKSELSIERQLSMYADGSLEFRPPKTKNGFRRITIGKDVLELLRQHQAVQFANKPADNPKWNEHDLVFLSEVGTPINASNLRRSFRRLIKESNLPKIRFHDLRHTAATLMINYGTPIPVVSQRLGHAKTSMTMDIYAHAIPSKQADAARLMEELMTPVAMPVAHGLHTEVKNEYKTGKS